MHETVTAKHGHISSSLCTIEGRKVFLDSKERSELGDTKVLNWSRKEIGDLRPDTGRYEWVHFRSAILLNARTQHGTTKTFWVENYTD